MTARRLLLFRTSGHGFAVEAGAVREILPATPSTRIRGAPPALAGQTFAQLATDVLLEPLLP